MSTSEHIPAFSYIAEPARESCENEPAERELTSRHGVFRGACWGVVGDQTLTPAMHNLSLARCYIAPLAYSVIPDDDVDDKHQRPTSHRTHYSHHPLPNYSYHPLPNSTLLAVVAGLLTLGCLLNRRKTSELQRVAQTPVPARPTHLTFFKWNIPVPDTAPHEGRLVSRFLARFPFLMEVHYW